MRYLLLILTFFSLLANDYSSQDTKFSRFSQLSATYTDSYGIEFVYIPAGSFTMGGNGDGTPHPVKITKGFYMGKTEITQAQWRKVMGSDPPELNFKGCDDCPVERVSWDDIQEFLKKINTASMLSGGKVKYALPTEAQWEYAARAGTTTAYYWGDTANKEYAWWSENADSKTHPVATKKPNAFGLYDMSGNVWEWCSDWRADYEEKETIDPTGPNSGNYKVIRGGSWNYSSFSMRSSYRFNVSPGDREYYFGFRLLLYMD